MRPSNFTQTGLSYALLFVCGLMFAVLLAARMGWLEPSAPQPDLLAGEVADEDTWMDIRQQGHRIGYAHRRLTATANGYALAEEITLRLNTMGMVQDLATTTSARLESDFSLRDFNFNLRSTLFDFNVGGIVDQDQLILDTGSGETRISLDHPLYAAPAILAAVGSQGLERDRELILHVLDPATLGQRAVQVKMLGWESIQAQGRTQRLQKVALNFMGTRQFAWLDAEGRVVREEGFLGIVLERSTRQAVLNGSSLQAGPDMTEQVAVASNVPIVAAEKLQSLRLRISGLTPSLFVDGGRQTYRNGLLQVDREMIPDPGDIKFESQEIHLGESPLIQSQHPKIVQQLNRIVAAEDRPGQKAAKIVQWIHTHIEKRPVLSVPSALQTLENRVGDCNEHAVLLAALARAAGIPTQIEAGLVYLRGRFYYHAWNVLYLGTWITADSALGQFPADVTHIRLVRGNPQQQLDLIAVIGKLDITIVEQLK